MATGHTSHADQLEVTISYIFIIMS